MVELREALLKAGVDTTNYNGIAFAMVLKALKGDLSAANWIKDAAVKRSKEEAKQLKDAVVIISGDDKLAE